MFLGIKMLYKSGYEWYMNNPLCKNFQNIDRIKTEKLCATEVEIFGSECEKKLILRKRPLKIWIIKFHWFLLETTI